MLLPSRRAMRPRPDTFTRYHMVDGRNVSTRYTWVEPCPRLPDDPRRALNSLMRFAASVWATFIFLWGGPRAVLRQRTMSARDWRLARDIIFHLEQLVRRILLVAALAMKLPPPRERAPMADSVRTPSHKPRAAKRENANAPRTWRVSFHAMPADAEPREHNPLVATRKRRVRPLDIKPTRGLARRMEALARAITQGRTHARRLALRLGRIAARNARANQPRLLAVPRWDFHPWARTPGKHAVNRGMEKAALLSIRELSRWNAQWIRLEPG